MIESVVGGLGLLLALVVLRRGLQPEAPRLRLLMAGPPPGINSVQEWSSARQPTRSELLKNLDRGQGASLLRLFPDLMNDKYVKDLRITGINAEQLAVTRLVALFIAPVGLLWLAALQALALLTVPWPLAVGTAAVLSAGAWFVPVITLRSQAAEAREEFRYALSAYLDLVAINLLGGSAVQESMQNAVDAGNGWVFVEIRRALAQTAQGTSAWEALTQLALAVGVVELEEVTSSMTLAGVEGARVGETLTAKADSLRARRLSEAETKAGRKSEQMSLGLGILALGLLLFILYPILSRLGATVGAS